MPRQISLLDLQLLINKTYDSLDELKEMLADYAEMQANKIRK